MPEGSRTVTADAVILALGGASWPKLGSDGAWVPWLEARGVTVESLQPANCGFDVDWTDHFRQKFAGVPVKTVGVVAKSLSGEVIRRMGEFVITTRGSKAA